MILPGQLLSFNKQTNFVLCKIKERALIHIFDKSCRICIGIPIPGPVKMLFLKTGGLAWILANTTGQAFGNLCHGNPSGESLICYLLVFKRTFDLKKLISQMIFCLRSLISLMKFNLRKWAKREWLY